MPEVATQTDIVLEDGAPRDSVAAVVSYVPKLTRQLEKYTKTGRKTAFEVAKKVELFRKNHLPLKSVYKVIFSVASNGDDAVRDKLVALMLEIKTRRWAVSPWGEFEDFEETVVFHRKGFTPKKWTASAAQAREWYNLNLFLASLTRQLGNGCPTEALKWVTFGLTADIAVIDGQFRLAMSERRGTLDGWYVRAACQWLTVVPDALFGACVARGLQAAPDEGFWIRRGHDAPATWKGWVWALRARLGQYAFAEEEEERVAVADVLDTVADYRALAEAYMSAAQQRTEEDGRAASVQERARSRERDRSLASERRLEMLEESREEEGEGLVMAVAMEAKAEVKVKKPRKKLTIQVDQVEYVGAGALKTGGLPSARTPGTARPKTPGTARPKTPRTGGFVRTILSARKIGFTNLMPPAAAAVTGA